MSRSWWIIPSLLVLAGCRYHTLEDGPYALTATETLRDDCGLAGNFSLGEGTLRTDGHQVQLTLADSGLRLIGTYRYSLEEMVLDGTLLNSPATLNGRSCLLETVAYHAETVTTSPTAFTGTMSVQFDTRQDDACSCRYWFRFSGQRR